MKQRRIPRRWLTVTAIGTAVLLLGCSAAALVRGGSAHAGATAGDRTTAQIERSSLSAGTTVSGQLGYGSASTVGGTGDAVVSALPTAGQIVAAGEVLYAVNGRPALVLTGDTPLWRDLSLGTTGPDVLALRHALQALGYDAGAESDTFDQALSTAIGALYRDRGYPEPRNLPGAREAQDEATRTWEQAKSDLAAARSALAARTSGPTTAERVRAENAVNEARRVLAQTQERASAPVPDPSSDSSGSGEGAVSVESATEQLRAAEAELADLTAAKDSSAEQAAVDAARESLDQARRAHDATMANGIRHSEAVMVPTEAVRVDTVSATLGQPASDAILSWTTTRLRVTASLTDGQAASIATGSTVHVTLPDHSALPGTVSAVEPARTDTDGARTGPTLVVDFTDAMPPAEVGLPAVTLTIQSDAVDEALTVPVTALVALAEGGYAVEVVQPDGSTRLVGVEVGLVAEARAQVLSDQLTEGTEVVLP